MLSFKTEFDRQKLYNLFMSTALLVTKYSYMYVCSFWPPLVGLLATAHDPLFRTDQRGRSE
jgi:hypothetical protein